MVLSVSSSDLIVATAHDYVGRPYDWHTFDCIHFIINVYHDVGINIPRFGGKGHPPEDLHLSIDRFASMPVGHSVFFKRKANTSNRIWTHAAIIVSPYELIHCSRHFGGKVVITSKVEFTEIYALVPKSP